MLSPASPISAVILSVVTRCGSALRGERRPKGPPPGEPEEDPTGPALRNGRVALRRLGVSDRCWSGDAAVKGLVCACAVARARTHVVQRHRSTPERRTPPTTATDVQAGRRGARSSSSVVVARAKPAEVSVSPARPFAYPRVRRRARSAARTRAGCVHTCGWAEWRAVGRRSEGALAQNRVSGY
jgi:hypothetical protein